MPLFLKAKTSLAGGKCGYGDQQRQLLTSQERPETQLLLPSVKLENRVGVALPLPVPPPPPQK